MPEGIHPPLLESQSFDDGDGAPEEIHAAPHIHSSPDRAFAEPGENVAPTHSCGPPHMVKLWNYIDLKIKLKIIY